MGIIDTAADRDAIYAAVKQLTRCADSLDTIAVALVKSCLDSPRAVSTKEFEKLREQVWDLLADQEERNASQD
jgi:hypothetical protein